MTIHLCHQGRQLGDFSKDQVEAMLKGGVIADDTLAWTSGLADWKTVRELLDPTKPPPIPPPPIASNEKPRPCGIPPVIDSSLLTNKSAPSEAAMRDLQKLSGDTKLGFLCILAWVLTFIFLAGATGTGGNGSTPSISGGLALLTMVAGLRGVARKATVMVLAKQNWQFCHFGRDIYLPAIWGTLWRTAIPVFLIAGIFAVGSTEPIHGARSSGLVLAFWILTFPLMLDIPLGYKSKIKLLMIASPAVLQRSTQNQKPAPQWRRNTIALILIPVLIVAAGGFYWWLTQKPTGKSARISEMQSEHQRFNKKLSQLANSETGLDQAGLDQVAKLQDSHYTNLVSQLAQLNSKAENKRVYDTMKPITDQAVVVRQKVQESMNKMLEAGFVDPTTLTNAEALDARKKLATTLLKDSTEALLFFSDYVEKLDSGLKAAGLAKVTRDKILVKNRSMQPILDELVNANVQTAKYALGVVTFLADNQGHWSMADGVCVFETQEKVDEYNKLFNKLQTCMLDGDRLNRSFFKEQ